MQHHKYTIDYQNQTDGLWEQIAEVNPHTEYSRVKITRRFLWWKYDSYDYIWNYTTDSERRKKAVEITSQQEHQSMRICEYQHTIDGFWVRPRTIWQNGHWI